MVEEVGEGGWGGVGFGEGLGGVPAGGEKGGEVWGTGAENLGGKGDFGLVDGDVGVAEGGVEEQGG